MWQSGVKTVEYSDRQYKLWDASLRMEGKEVFTIRVEVVDGQFAARAGYLGVSVAWFDDAYTPWVFAPTPEEAIKGALALSDDVVDDLKVRFTALHAMTTFVESANMPTLSEAYKKLKAESHQLTIVQLRLRDFSDFPAASDFAV